METNREMVNSGIPWIGEIPKDWSNAKYRYSGEFVKGKLPKEQNVEQLGKPIIGASEMLGKDCRNFSTDESVPTCQKKDILILWDGANAGIVANNCEGIVSSTTVKYVCTDKKFDAQYLFYLFKNGEPFFRSKVNGTTIPHMNQKYIDEYLCIQPSLAEQQRIAEFLDRKCAEVDEMIGLQEQIIEELKAYKQSVITKAVTKGLNPDAPMKDSGIEWIGKIPEHWSLLRLKSIVVKIESGVSVNASGDYEEKGGEYVLKTSCVSRNTFIPTECKKVEAYDLHRVDCPVKKDTLIVSRMNTPELVGSCGYSQEDIDNIYLPDRLWQVSLNESVFTKFYWYLLISSSTRNYFSSLSTGTSSSMQNISQPQFNSTPIVIPCIDEQKSIVKHLDTKCTEIDNLISIKLSKIDSLKEYKKSIIYEYVTGKREVNE